MRRTRQIRRWALPVALLALSGPVGLYARVRWTDNFGEVVPGRIYRSAQMSGASLDRMIRARGIRTVLNLRGPNPGQPWYREERAATLGAGATLADVAMSSCQWMSRAQLRAVVRVLDTCEYPLLIHCQHGSERTGLVAAVAELLHPGSTLDDARTQFSIRHLFVRIKDGRLMAEHLDQYADWLRRKGRAHSPEQFRRWVEAGFTPREPSREQWPYDPYPLVVETRPPAPPPVARGVGATRR